jgi:hypothetical protein
MFKTLKQLVLFGPKPEKLTPEAAARPVVISYERLNAFRFFNRVIGGSVGFILGAIIGLIVGTIL